VPEFRHGAPFGGTQGDTMWIVNPAEMTKKAKAERKPPMRAYASLPKEDLDALGAYMVSLKKK
jgi:hypothetical protein